MFAASWSIREILAGKDRESPWGEREREGEGGIERERERGYSLGVET